MLDAEQIIEMNRPLNQDSRETPDILDKAGILLSDTRLENFGSWINGTLIKGEGSCIDLINPATGEHFLRYQDAGENVVNHAANVAKSAQKQWMAKSASERGNLMWQCGSVIQQFNEALAQIESVSSGKPIRDCRIEIEKVSQMFTYYAGWCDKLKGEVIPVPGSHLNYTQRQPYGVVTQITPWNAPLFTAGWQIAPAICCGNAVMLKPSELTPVSSTILVRLIESAGIPKGLVNVINGLGETTANAAITHASCKKVVFVGSPGTGKIIARTAAENLIPCVLELGGKSANIVFSDARINAAVAGAQNAIFSAAGQSCVSGSRLLLQENIYSSFCEQLASAMQKVQPDLPWLDKTIIGPVSHQQHFQRIQQMISQGQTEGADVISSEQNNADNTNSGGFFIQPTLLKNVTNSMQVAREEIFGPVVCAIPFKDEADAVEIANDSDFGLAGAVWTNDVARAHRVAGAVNAGTFWINSYKVINVMSPFGGFNQSGYGRSSGYEGLMEYTQSKSVWVETAENPPSVFGY